MKTLIRITGVFAAALILAMVLTSVTESPRRAYAGCGSDVTWHIWNEIDSRQTSDTVNGKTTGTADWSSRSEHHSDNGQESTDLHTRHVNADGSYHEHEEVHQSDSEGKGCYSDGIPWKGDSRSDDDRDSQGNFKRHNETIIEKNGKCTKYVWDREWDRSGKLIKETKSESEVPCSKYILEVSMKGSFSDSGSTITYGPNTAKVYLEVRDGTYVGSYEGVFDAKVTGECNGFGTYPVTFNVTAKEDEFGDLDFSVESSMGMAMAGSCKGAGGSVSMPPVKGKPRTFTLPAEEGASKVYSMPLGGSGNITITYTLRRKP